MMKVVAVIVTLLLALALWAQVGHQNEKPANHMNEEGPLPGFSRSTYELTAKTAIKYGIRAYAETEYTFFETTKSGKRELWSVLSRDKYAHHWISPNGMVWVVTSGMPGPGGSAKLWARDLRGSLRGEWGGHRFQTRDPKTRTQREVALNADASASSAISLYGGNEQLRMLDKQGNELRLTIANTEVGSFAVSRIFLKGETKNDLLTELLNQPMSAPHVEWVVPNRVPIAIWTFYGAGPNQHLIQTYNLGGSTGNHPDQMLVAERLSPRKPAFVEVSSTGKVLWFEFGALGEPARATLDIMTLNGLTTKSVDLLALGKFQSSDEAKRSIIYRDPLVNCGYGLEPNDPMKMATTPRLEVIQLQDRTGRKYQIEVVSKGQNTPEFDVRASASLNLNRVATKEPTYPGANILGEEKHNSPDGKFSIRLKKYEQEGKSQSQLTLIAHVADPVDGQQSVELFSIPVVNDLKSVRVSNSGRVFAISYPKFPPNSKEVCFFQAWDPSGRFMGLDLLQSLKWFKNLEEAKSKIDLSKATFELEGLKSERMVEGVPVPNYISEAVAFNLGDRTERIYIAYMNDQIPTMFYSSKPKR